MVSKSIKNQVPQMAIFPSSLSSLLKTVKGLSFKQDLITFGQRMKAALVFLGFLLANMQAYAQQAEHSVFGQVIDQQQHPLPYATVRLPGKGIGTAANADGEFALRLPAAANQDTLEISALGYQTKWVPLAGNHKLTIILLPDPISLKTVSIIYRNPLKLIAKAKSLIPVNYISKSHVIRGFYRETAMKGEMPLEVSEAVFDIFNYGYSDPRQDQFNLIKALDEKNDRDFHYLEAGERPNAIFDEDIVKILDHSDILSDEAIKRHQFEVSGITDYEGRPAYEINFSEKQAGGVNTFRGRILIDTADYAFVYFDYGMSPDAMKKYRFGNTGQRLMMKLMGIDIGVLSQRSRTRYQRMGDRWVLAGTTGNNVLYFKSPRLHYDFRADMRVDYVVTEVDTTRHTPFSEVMRGNEHINDHDTEDGPAFWGDYNIMLPEHNTEELIRKVRDINNGQQLQQRFEQMAKKLPKDPQLRIDSMLSFYHANGQFNGTALISSQGKILLGKSYGWANMEKQSGANVNTTYRIGSLSKSFTGVIIDQLIAEGKIDLNAPVKTYLPWYVHGGVTVQQLLTHQSGIPDYFNDDEYKRQLMTQPFTLRSVVEKFCSDTLEFKSGTAFGYSNSNFAVLAPVAQEAAGKPFNELLQERIFTPAGMSDTFFGNSSGRPGQADGYDNGVHEIPYEIANTAGAGGISSSAADLLKFHDALQDHRLLTQAATDTMLKPRVLFSDYNAWYDHGWMTDKDYFSVSNHHQIIYNAGTDQGFYTMYVRVPDTNSCIILLSNNGNFPRYEIADMILQVLNKYSW